MAAATTTSNSPETVSLEFRGGDGSVIATENERSQKAFQLWDCGRKRWAAGAASGDFEVANLIEFSPPAREILRRQERTGRRAARAAMARVALPRRLGRRGPPPKSKHVPSRRGDAHGGDRRVRHGHQQVQRPFHPAFQSAAE